MKHLLLLSILISAGFSAIAQRTIHGQVMNHQTGEPVEGATVSLQDSSNAVLCDSKGKFFISILPSSSLIISAVGFETKLFTPSTKDHFIVLLTSQQKELDAVVVSGTMRAVKNWKVL